MKGKKSNIAFVSEFMSECVKDGKVSPEQIKETAETKLKEIDNKIQELELLKLTRSDLLDVIETFGGKNKLPEELNLYSLNLPNICQDICVLMVTNPISMSSINSNKHDPQDIIFCIKQLIEHSIISKVDDILLRGDNFEKYLHLFKKAI